MKKLVVKTGPVDDFFRRGRAIAKRLDAGQPIAEERVIGFEDPADLMRLLTGARVDLIRQVKVQPGSITSIAQALSRDRSAVKRDVDELVRAGIVEVRETVLPGHGRQKEVRAAAGRLTLQAAF